jgi:hypothetical protein
LDLNRASLDFKLIAMSLFVFGIIIKCKKLNLYKAISSNGFLIILNLGINLQSEHISGNKALSFMRISSLWKWQQLV